MAAGHLTASPSYIVFPPAVVRTPAPDQTLTLTETAGQAVTITGATISGDAAADFALGTVPGSVPANGTATLTVHCTPSLATARDALLTITHSGDDNPLYVQITDIGTGMLTTPPAWSFPPVLVGQAAPTLMLALTNNTASPAVDLTITSVAISGPNAADFSVSGGTGVTLKKNGAAVYLPVGCTPSAAGARSAIITVTHTASDSPETVSLSATGLTRVTSGSSGDTAIQKQVPEHHFALLGIEPQSQLMLTALLTIAWPDGAIDTLPAHVAAAVYGGGATFDRTGSMWAAYTVKGSGVLSVIQEANLLTVLAGSPIAVLARITAQGILPHQVL